MREWEENAASMGQIEQRLGTRLMDLRVERGLSLDDLAKHTGISRATLSRIERAESSPTTTILSRLCAVYGWTLSRLMTEAEGEAPALVRTADQPVWTDPETGFRRRAASPSGPRLRMELIICELPAGKTVAYPDAPVPGMEQHLIVLTGVLDFCLGTQKWQLNARDCLRVRIDGPISFSASGAHPTSYLMALCHS